MVVVLPYHRIEKFTVWRQEDESDKATYAATYYLKEALDGKRDVNGQFLLSFSYDAQNDFYLRALQTKGVKIAYKTVDTVASGDEVIVHEPETMAALNQHAVAERVLHYPGVDVLRVISVQ